jgi:ATP-dependent helicase/nuclease subunit B
LELRGRIDRLDICRKPGSDAVHCLVLDYKSSHKQLDDILMANGLQLQLLAYLGVVSQVIEKHEQFGGKRLVPVGVFYLNLRGTQERRPHRAAASEDTEAALKQAYAHHGRFDRAALPMLDARTGVREGDQFNYRPNLDGSVSGNSVQALETESFRQLTRSVEDALRDIGRRVFSGAIRVDPYKKGKALACDQCDFQSICRIDPWAHVYRKLK